MGKKFFKKIIGSVIIGTFGILGISHNNNSNTEQINSPKYQIPPIENSILEESINNRIENHKLIPKAINEPILNISKNNNKINLSSKQIIEILNKIKKKIKNNSKISDNEIKFLKNYYNYFKNIKENELKWYQKEAIWYLNLIKIRNVNLIIKNEAKKFINLNSSKINHELLLRNINKKTALKRIKGGLIIVDFAKINENLAANIYRLCLKYKINIKLAFTIFLIENNFGNIKVSNSGAQGMGQVMKSFLIKIYKNKKLNEWDKFVATFIYLKQIEKELNINISDPYQIKKEDFILALNGYFDGVTNMHKNPTQIYVKNDLGFNYALKGLVALNLLKFQIPTQIELKNNDNRFKIINYKLV